MRFFILVVLLIGSAQVGFATEINQIKIQVSLNLKRCDDSFVNLEPQNCQDGIPTEKDLTFDLATNCKQVGDSNVCTRSAMVTSIMDKGSANAIIVISKKTSTQGVQILATVILVPSVNSLQQSVLTLTLPETGLFPPKTGLGAAVFKVADDSHIYFPSLVIK